MRKDERWWGKKWYWMLCILLAFVLVPLINLFFFPEIPMSRSLIYAVASSVGVLLAYFAYMNKPILKIQPETLRRIIFIMGGAFFVGFMVWAALVYLCLHLQLLDHPVIGTLLGVALIALMLIFALIMDKLGKRRNYEPLISGGGNI
jgi:peptidoglycan biosynthesis protein MviN/MurJ (putative lipid II flippase)